MFHRVLMCAVLLAGSSVYGADYVLDRRAAIELVKAGKNEEALEAFVALAGIATSDFQKSDALDLAARAADRLKQPERALELALEIPLPAVSKACRMYLLEGQRKWKEMLEQFQDEDIDAWPDELKGDALFLRGGAHYILKNGTAAERDLKLAAEYLIDPNSRGLCLNRLGDTWRDLLKDDAQAIAAYRQVYATGNVYKHCQAAICITAILKSQGKSADAVREFDRIPLDQVTAPYWRSALLVSHAGALAAAGRTDDAITYYQQVQAMQDVPEATRRESAAALKKLQPR